MPKTAVPQTLEEWLTDCPLRKWLDRKPHGARAKLALDCGVHNSTFGHWLRGAVIPQRRHIARLNEATGITLEQWVRWAGRKPEAE